MNTAVTRNDWVGRVIDGRFPLLEWLGNTEQAGVFRTELKGPQPARAVIRLVPAQPEYAEARLQHWKQAAALSHPSLMRILSCGRAQVGGVELLYLVTEYAEEALAQVIPERPLSQSEAREMLGPILDVLAYLHGQGMVHGRIKPSNVMVVGDRLKLTGESAQAFGKLSGPQAPLSVYDAPEVASGTILPASDIWSLGITLVQALEQEPPKWDRAAKREPVVPAGVPEPFAAIARRCLRIDPAQRASLSEIRGLLSGSPSLHEPASEPANELDQLAPAEPLVHSHAPAGELSRPKPRIIAIACAVVVLLAVIVFILMRPHAPRPATPAATSPAPTAAPPAPQQHSPTSQPPPRSSASSKGEVAERVMPNVLASANRTIHGTVEITVRVNVDASGSVADAKLESHGRSRYFSSRALDAARKWRFKPAEKDGAAVPSAWNLHFMFRRSGPEVNAVEVSP